MILLAEYTACQDRNGLLAPYELTSWIIQGTRAQIYAVLAKFVRRICKEGEKMRTYITTFHLAECAQCSILYPSRLELRNRAAEYVRTFAYVAKICC